MREMPMKCGLLARFGAASRCERKKILDARERRAGIGIASSRTGRARKKFFCIIVRNRLPIAPDAGRIARIGRVPIRHDFILRSDRDGRTARRCASQTAEAASWRRFRPSRRPMTRGIDARASRSTVATRPRDARRPLEGLLPVPDAPIERCFAAARLASALLAPHQRKARPSTGVRASARRRKAR